MKILKALMILLVGILAVSSATAQQAELAEQVDPAAMTGRVRPDLHYNDRWVTAASLQGSRNRLVEVPNHVPNNMLTAEIGQVGTQWDGLGDPMIKVSGVPGWEDGNHFYNGFRLEDVGSPRGLQAVDNEHLAEIGFFTRGILIDIAALKGVNRLDKDYAITVADFNAALEAQASQGDVVLFRTGWNSLWKDYSSIDPSWIAEVGSGEPGVSPEVYGHLAEKKISMIGFDIPGLEPYDFSQGVFENLDLDKLSREKAYELTFVWSPLKPIGATGSVGNPVAAW